MKFQSSLLFLLWTINRLAFPIDNSEDKEKSLSTSITGMVELLAIERDLIDSVDRYAALLQRKVDTLKKWVKSEKCWRIEQKKKKKEY